MPRADDRGLDGVHQVTLHETVRKACQNDPHAFRRSEWPAKIWPESSAPTLEDAQRDLGSRGLQNLHRIRIALTHVAGFRRVAREIDVCVLFFYYFFPFIGHHVRWVVDTMSGWGGRDPDMVSASRANAGTRSGEGGGARLPTRVDNPRPLRALSVRERCVGRHDARVQEARSHEGFDDAPNLSLRNAGLESDPVLGWPALVVRGDVNLHGVEHESFGRAQRPARLVVETLTLSRPVSLRSFREEGRGRCCNGTLFKRHRCDAFSGKHEASRAHDRSGCSRAPTPRAPIRARAATGARGIARRPIGAAGSGPPRREFRPPRSRSRRRSHGTANRRAEVLDQPNNRILEIPVAATGIPVRARLRPAFSDLFGDRDPRFARRFLIVLTLGV